VATCPRFGSKRYLQTLTEIAVEKNSTIIFPLPVDTIKVFLDRLVTVHHIRIHSGGRTAATHNRSMSIRIPFKGKRQSMTSNMRTTLRLSVTSLLIVLLLTACGGPSGVTATLNDTGIQLSSATATTASDVTFHIKNTSAAETHEFVVIQTDLPADQLIPGADNRLDEEKLTSMGEKGDILFGQGSDLALKLPAGHYLLICNLPGHYQAGMHAAFTVTS